MNKLSVISASLLTVMGLSACQSMPQNATPSEVVRYGMKKSLLVDNQYNFDSKMMVLVDADAAEKKAVILDAKDKERAAAWAKEYGEEAADEAEEEETSAAKKTKRNKPYEIIETRGDDVVAEDVAASEESEETEGDTYEELYGRGSYLTRIFAFPVAQGFTKQSHFTVQGAVDLRRGQFEVSPAFNIQAAGLQAKNEMSLSLDLGKKEMLVAPNAIAESILSAYLAKEDNGRQVLKAAHNKYLKMGMTKEMETLIKAVPLRSMMKALPEAMDMAYAAMGDDAFEALAMDDYGRQLGASHRIRMHMTETNMALFTQVFSTELVRILKDIEGDKLDADIKPEDYARFVNMINSLFQDAGGEFLSMILKNPMGNMNQSDDVYLSNNGRLLGMQQILPIESDKNQKAIVSLRTQTRIYNYGRPQFKVKPNANEIYDLTPLLEKKMGKLSLDSLVEDDDESEAAADAEIASEVTAEE